MANSISSHKTNDALFSANETDIAHKHAAKTSISSKILHTKGESQKRKNIILVMVESWDGRVLSLWGDPAMRHLTPNLNKFAQQGVSFKYNYTSHPICCPDRANLWSGQYTYNCKSWNNHKGLDFDTPILRDVLTVHGNYVLASNQKGRADIGIGKHDYRKGGHTNQNRITAWTGAANIQLPSYLQKKPKIIKRKKKKVHLNDWMRVAVAKKFLKKQTKQKKRDPDNKNPFFLYLSLTTPHPQFKTSKKWLSKVDYDKVSIPPKDTEVHPTIKYQQINKDWKWGFDEENVRKTRAIYYAMIAETDAFIGDLLDTVEELDLGDDTYIIITSDHGENNMEHELFYKMNMYESSVNTPLLIKGPGIKKDVISEKIVSLIDLYPTILDMADIPLEKAPLKLDGESILPYLRGENESTRNWAFSMYTGKNIAKSLLANIEKELKKKRYHYLNMGQKK